MRIAAMSNSDGERYASNRTAEKRSTASAAGDDAGNQLHGRNGEGPAGGPRLTLRTRLGHLFASDFAAASPLPVYAGQPTLVGSVRVLGIVADILRRTQDSDKCSSRCEAGNFSRAGRLLPSRNDRPSLLQRRGGHPFGPERCFVAPPSGTGPDACSRAHASRSQAHARRMASVSKAGRFQQACTRYPIARRVQPRGEQVRILLGALKHQSVAAFDKLWRAHSANGHLVHFFRSGFPGNGS